MDTELNQVRAAITSLWGRLIAIEKELQVIHAQMQELQSAHVMPVEKSIQHESLQRHASEVKSGEYDMQG